MDIFIDSSIIIEVFKENKEALQIVEIIKDRTNVIPHINSIVVSEVSYFLLKKTKISVQEIKDLLFDYKFLDINKEITNRIFGYLDKYELYPNDAFILATCKYYGIKTLLSMDNDFIKCCLQEKITLINSPDLSSHIK